MKWFGEERRRRMQDVFGRFNIPLPDEFEELSYRDRLLLDERVEDTCFDMNRDLQGVNEEELSKEEFDFVSEDDWKEIKDGKAMSMEKPSPKHFPGKNYMMEFTRSGNDAFLHLFVQGMVAIHPEVSERLIHIMQPNVPSGQGWRIGIEFHDGVEPMQSLDNRSGICSAYRITFERATERVGAVYFMNKMMKAILGKFIMPQHYPIGTPGA